MTSLSLPCQPRPWPVGKEGEGGWGGVRGIGAVGLGENEGGGGGRGGAQGRCRGKRVLLRAVQGRQGSQGLRVGLRRLLCRHENSWHGRPGGRAVG
jgi:hypothetical protein